MTIHRIGKKPNAAPSVPASRACPSGIEYAKTATASATTREMMAASQARMRSTPSSTNRVAKGRAANTDVRKSEPPTESRTGLYMVQPSVETGPPTTSATDPGRSGPVEQVRGTSSPQRRVQDLDRVRGRDRGPGPP